MTRFGSDYTCALMSFVYSCRDYQSVLKGEFEIRKKSNSAYSVRAFARDLGVSPSKLVEILKNNAAISTSLAARIVKNLSFTVSEKEYYMNLVQAKYDRSLKTRKKAKTFLKNFSEKNQFVTQKSKDPAVCKEWYFLLLIELLTAKMAKSSAEIAKIIGVSESEILWATEDVVKMGFLRQTPSGRFEKSAPNLKFESPLPSEKIRAYHKAYLNKAYAAIDTQPIKARKYLSSVFGVRADQIEDVRQELERFNENFLKKFSVTDSAEQVYSFALQLFRLDTTEGL